METEETDQKQDTSEQPSQLSVEEMRAVVHRELPQWFPGEYDEGVQDTEHS